MSLQIGPYTFDRTHYDRDADVLYLARGFVRAAGWEETPDGHAVRYDKSGNLIGLTLVDVQRLIEEAGDSERIVLGLPKKVEPPPLTRADLTPADVKLADLKHALS
ncbi:MAG TPA: DUF2283 domain-containing protein [Solirubrobacteraceae bacterium]|jgi:uncharacterized protein YuzE|nr:DUF2283 domain-containing protein [Solirubrobacteraceae bacterium]